MGATRVVHVVGTGTLGGPVMSLLLHLQHELEVDEITFHKNRPLLNDRTKILSLMRRGAKLAVEAEKMADFEKLGMLPTYTRQSALEQATVVIDCTAEGLRLQHKRVWYEHMPAARGFIAQGREFGFGKMYAHGINDAVLVPNEDRFLQVVSCNTHNLAVLIETLALQANKYVALTEKTMASTVFSFGRDHGYFGRLLNQTVVSMPMHDALPV